MTPPHDDVRAPAPAPLQAPQRAAGAPLRAVRVLVVDDAAPVARATSRLLELFGHVAGVASTGAQALALVAQDPRWDLVLLDLGLPDMDGREVLRRVKAARPELPVIVCSGAGRDEVEQTLPGVRFVAKPFPIEVLLAAVEEATAPPPPSP